MSVLTCPSCRGSLTVELAPAPYVVGCPHCRKPLTVPATEPEPADPEPEDEAPEESPFAVAPRKRSKYRPARSGGSGKWVVLIVVGVVLVVAVGGLALFVPSAFRDTERHQMDSYYSELTDDIKDGFARMDANPASDTSTAVGNVVAKMNAALSKLWGDYKAKYGTDPKYLKPKDRADPNPMRLRYPY